jgi:ABC-type multidrug transport system ATPase subunit
MNSEQEPSPIPKMPTTVDQSSSSLVERKKRLQTTYSTQAKALFLKNAAQQRRSWLSNLLLIGTPILFCILLFVLQKVIDNVINSDDDNRCGCFCLNCCTTIDGIENCRAPIDGFCFDPSECKEEDKNTCGLVYSNADQSNFCAIPNPSIWPALYQVPAPGYLDEEWAPNAAMPYTGDDQQTATLLATQLFGRSNPTPGQIAQAEAFLLQGAVVSQQESGGSPVFYAGAISFLDVQLGTFKDNDGYFTNYVDPAFITTGGYNGTLYNMLGLNDTDSSSNSSSTAVLTAFFELASQSDRTGQINLPPPAPLNVEPVWQENADDINNLLYCGYRQARCNGTVGITNGITGAYDFLNSSSTQGSFNMRMWYNETGRYGTSGQGEPTRNLRVNAPLNAAVNAWIKSAIDETAAALLVGLMELPKPQTTLRLDFGSLLGPLFYTWLLQLLLPMMLVTLVYEKEHRLRTIMKMHGLGDGAYWTIQYSWFLLVNFLYSWVLIGFGSAIDLSFFTLTEYSFQLVFYFLWINCLIAFAFLLSTLFKSSRTATVVSFLYVFGTGLVGYLLIQQFVANDNWWVVFLYLIPGFGLYAGLWEISQYAFRAAYQGSDGTTWSTLSDDNNQIPIVMIIFVVEWFVFLVAAWYLEQVIPTGVGIPRHPLFFLGKNYEVKENESGGVPPLQHQGEGGHGNADEVTVSLEPADVAGERQRTLELVSKMDTTATTTTTTATNGSTNDSSTTTNSINGGIKKYGDAYFYTQEQHPIIIKNLRKVFPPLSRTAPQKIAVQSLTMAVEKGECFGLLGPNGAGKSTTINMLTGFMTPTAGTATIVGHDIRSEMPQIHQLMGVCPQDNLIWDTLTAKEHLFFYGRLKNLKGKALDSAVEAALRSVNLFNGGVGDRQTKTYSGGMKRRLSVAISFMGDPLVVYLDEPSTGLDPASRQNLWDVVRRAKAKRGIILTTHSMQEASALCDRLGIFVDGQLVCLGNPKQLTTRYGGHFILQITTTAGEEQEEKVRRMVMERLTKRAKVTYALAGTQKFELPAGDVTLAQVFEEVGRGGGDGGLKILDWGVHNATLEEVFIDLATGST